MNRNLQYNQNSHQKSSTFSRGNYPRNIRSQRQLIDWIIKNDRAERKLASERAIFAAIYHVPSTRPDFHDPSTIKWFDQTTCDVTCSAVGHA